MEHYDGCDKELRWFCRWCGKMVCDCHGCDDNKVAETQA